MYADTYAYTRTPFNTERTVLMTDKLEHINKMIAALQKEKDLNANQRILLNVYKKKKEQLKK